jgi:predicted nucleic acid-binding protein
MMTVFADTAYWIASASPHDQWAAEARRARAGLGNAVLLTTDEVLAEFLTSFADQGPGVRGRVARTVRAILADRRIEVLAQRRESFMAGLALYERRPDKSYSLVDCIIMQTMRTRGITDILTVDRHFAQEGFTVPMRAE